MPQIVQYIDKFAREKQRDVLFIIFKLPDNDGFFVDYQKLKPRKKIINWLEKNKIGWSPCAFQGQMMGCSGTIYLDVPFDTADPTYQKLSGYLENPDGTMKIEGVTFGYLPLEQAMQYAEQDKPGYWESEF